MTSAGTYALITSIGGCETISECIKVFVTGIDEETLIQNVKVYPNPNNGNFTIESVENLSISVYNTTGQLIYKGSQEPGVNEIKLGNNIETGLYVIKMTNKNGYSQHKNIVIHY